MKNYDFQPYILPKLELSLTKEILRRILRWHFINLLKAIINLLQRGIKLLKCLTFYCLLYCCQLEVIHSKTKENNCHRKSSKNNWPIWAFHVLMSIVLIQKEQTWGFKCNKRVVLWKKNEIKIQIQIKMGFG